MNRNSHTHLTETPSFAWYVAAALEPLPQFASVHTNNSLIVPAYQSKPESIKILISRVGSIHK